MPQRNPPWEIGDDIYQQYDLRQGYPISANLAVTKGDLYTFDSDGYLAAITAVGGVAQLARGCVQATDSVAAAAYTPAAGGEYPDPNAPTVQCLTNFSFIVIKAVADITRNQRVSVSASGTTVTADKIEATAQADTLPSDYLGVVHDILNYNEEYNVPSTPKRKTLDNDLIVVRRGAI